MKKIFLSLILVLFVLFTSACSGSKYKLDLNNTVDYTGLTTSESYTALIDFSKRPDKYLGKTIKLKGTYSVKEQSNKTYHCLQCRDEKFNSGVEFILKDKKDYPNPGDVIVVAGVFNTYLENGQQYCHLEQAVIIDE